MKKAFILLSLLLIVPFMAFSAGSKDVQNVEQESEKITFPLKETVELKIATPDGTTASLSANLPIWQEIERRTNVKIVWDAIAPSQYNDVMKLRISAGVNALPDIMMVPNGLSLAELGEQGVIVDLKDELEVNGQDILSVYEEFPNVKAVANAGGKIYTINTIRDRDLAPYGLIIRQDWLDRLGLETPETLEDWVTVLRAFRDQDANGNGDPNDEIPFSAGGHAWYTTFWGYLWDLNLFQSDGWHAREDGKMTYDFTSDEAYEFYQWLNGIYSEGLLDPEFMTLGGESALYAKVSQNTVGAFTAYPGRIPMIESALEAMGVEDAYLKPVVMPVGPGGQHQEVVNRVNVNGYAVTGACKNKSVAVALLNYIYGTEEGQELMNFGLEGVTYTKNADGTYSYTEKVTNDPNGRAPKTVLNEYGCRLGAPFVSMDEAADTEIFSYPERLREDVIALNEETEKFAVQQLALPPATEEESARISGMSGNISSYIWEMTGKFTVSPFTRADWDKYVKALNNMGLQDLLEVKQAQYDRLLAE